MIKKIAGLGILFSFFAIASQADIAPDPGFTRVTVNLVLDLKEDIPGFRYFVISGDLVREINLKKGEKTTVDSPGGGVRYSSGVLYAIPSKSSQMPSDETAARKIPGSVMLVRHNFHNTVRTADAGNVKDAVYRIELSPTGPKAVEVTDRKNGNDITNSNRPGSDVNQATSNSVGVNVSRGLDLSGWTTVAFGTLISLAVVALGLWLFFRVSRRMK